MASWALDVSIY